MNNGLRYLKQIATQVTLIWSMRHTALGTLNNTQRDTGDISVIMVCRITIFLSRGLGALPLARCHTCHTFVTPRLNLGLLSTKYTDIWTVWRTLHYTNWTQKLSTVLPWAQACVYRYTKQDALSIMVTKYRGRGRGRPRGQFSWKFPSRRIGACAISLNFWA